MGWLRRLKSHFRQERLARDIQDDIEAHLELRAREHIQQGMAPGEARRAAALSFGNVTAHREQARDAELIGWLDAAWQNLRYAVRVLRKSRAATAAAVLSIAIGIGANTAVFSLLNAVMLKPLPVPDPQQLVAVDYQPLDPLGGPPSPNAYSANTYHALREGAKQYIDLWAGEGSMPVMTFGDLSEPFHVMVNTGNYYSILRARPYLGRLIGPGDDAESDRRMVTVLSYGAWRKQFRGDRSIVGKSILFNRLPFVVIGVEPESFSDSPVSVGVDAVVPFAAAKLVAAPDADAAAFPSGRLRLGVSLRQAQDALNAIYNRVARGCRSVSNPRWAIFPTFGNITVRR